MTRRFSSLPIALLVAIAACAGCRSPEPAARAAAGTGETSGSIYALNLPLVSQSGQHVQLSDLAGRPVVAAMIYTSCTSVCPRVTEDMRTAERQLDATTRRRVTFALFSLDPGRDTPAALSRFAAEHGLDASGWRLFAASEDGTRDLAAVLGVKYRPEAGGVIAHSALIVVLDRRGEIVYRRLGLAEDPAELARAVARAER